MTKPVCLAVCFSVLFTFATNAGETRTWTSTSGTHKTEAELVKVSDDGKTITLRKTDGQNTDVLLEKLSKEDQAYVKKYLNDKKTPPTPNRPSAPVPQPTRNQQADSKEKSLLRRKIDLESI